MDLKTALKKLQQLADPAIISNKEQRFGIVANNAIGVYQKDIKLLAREIGIDSTLAELCFDSGIYEAKILCSKIHAPNALTKTKMNQWVRNFENWEICDSFCMGLFAKNKHALALADDWTTRKHEFTKRAGFVIMACYGFNHKNAPNSIFKKFFPVMIREAKDERVYVRKAINWALRQVGKRNPDLQAQAITVANKILKIDHPSAQWIAKDALRELNKPNVSILNYPRTIYSA
ncbi:MAG: DNA alkylation repair protein [Gammaproteobacteria bacterium]